MFKKFLSWVLTAVMLAGVLPVSSFAAASSKVNFTDYVFDDFEDGVFENGSWRSNSITSGTCSFYVDSAAMPGNPDNKALYMNNPSDSSGFKTLLQEQSLDIASDLYFEIDMRINSLANTQNIGEIYIDGVSPTSILRFNCTSGVPDTLQVNYRKDDNSGNSRKTIMENWALESWYNIKLYIKSRENTFSLMINDNLLVDEMKFPLDFSDAKIGQYKMTGFRWQFTQAGQMVVDNIYIDTYPKAEFLKAVPSDASIPIHPSEDISLEMSGFVNNMELKLNDVPVSNDAITAKDGIFTVEPGRLDWNMDYTLTGTASDIFGESCSISVPFRTKALLGSSVDMIGFEDSQGTKLTSLAAGVVNAKLIYEADSSGTSYVAIAGLYKKTDGIIELVDIVTVTNSNAGTYETVTLPLTVPFDNENMFIDVYMWNSLLSRTRFDTEAYYGKMRLE